MDEVAIYCRLSDEDRDKINSFSDSESIQNQKNLLMRYALDRNWNIYKVYSDDDYSGLDKNRPEFNQMLKDAESGKFNIILCKHQSRFTRDMELVEKYLHTKFIEWGIRFVTVVDGVDTSDKHNKKSRQINGLINEWYSEDISESIKSVFRLKQQQGKYIGSFAAYGYMKDPKDKNKLIIDEAAAETVRKIFAWYLNGYGTQQISHMLNNMNIPNPTKYKQLQGCNYINTSAKDDFGFWSKTTVQRILKNQLYIGNMVQHVHQKLNYKSNKRVALPPEDWIIVENTHMPIIDTADFNIVQERLKSKVRSTGMGQTHVFAGKVRCMDCGNTLVTNSSQPGYKYLRCKSYSTRTKDRLCSSHTIRLSTLEEIITKKVKEYFSLLEDDNIASKLSVNSSFKEKLKSLQKQLNSLERDIRERENAIKNLYLDKVKGLISEQQFSEFNLIFCKERDDLARKQHTLQTTIENINDSSDEINKYKKIISEYKNFCELNHAMVNELIDFIEVGEKDTKTKEQRIKINWLF
jgi:site-specific DNA recombinase